ncbi:MAG: DUF4835 domain-containing protein [Bacteroidetes bacterium HGW-Bacteroidetes-21]|jgi:hypothetical protein|nr:MAG: DUF4835 domain-containing protein [Bacteroidetes bacterium HGW-Bacteroidetes-21]
MKSFVLTISLSLLFLFAASAQELNCRISVVSPQVQGTNKKVFESMQKDLYEFMNNRKWTDNVFSVDERIECNILINISEQISSDEFKGTLQIQCNRPVFGTNYNTVLLNYKDNDIHFRYIEFQSMDFNENSHIANLTSIMAFYAYIVLGLDYDTFSPQGGSVYFQKAEKIVSNAQSATETGWKAYESQKNRYWLIENILSSKYAPVRDFFYSYHRQGFDIMSEKQAEGRAMISESLKGLQKVYREKPSPFMNYLQLVFDAKSDEFVNVFSESFPDEKAAVVNLLKEIDAANAGKYQKIMQSQ